MQTYELRVVERSVLANSADTTLVRTSIGIDQVHVLFDNAEWLDFPISATFTNSADSESRTTSLTVAEISGSVDFVAEATCEIPWEVIQTLGAIRVTFQGTNSDGDHIITAAGAPLSVVEAGDVAEGSVPAGAPTQSEWEQAYADAMSAINQLSSKLAEADAAIAAAEALEVPIATDDNAGIVQPDGVTIDIDGQGLLTCIMEPEFPIATTEVLGGVMGDGDTVDIDDGGVISVTSVPSSALPIASSSTPGGVMVDASTITADVDGTISVASVPAVDIVGVIDPSNLPSYVDDVIEGYYYEGAFYSDAEHTTAITGEQGKIYVDLSTDTSYRWSGSAFISISNPIDIATQAEAEAGIDNTKMMTPLRVKQAIDENAYELPAATSSTLGGVKPDGTTITADADGTIHGASTYELPTMTANIKGGAKLGSGLRVDDDALSVGNLVHSGSGAEVVTDGCAIYSVDAQGWAEQDGTPTPENPQEIRVARGRNLLNPADASTNVAFADNRYTNAITDTASLASLTLRLYTASTYTTIASSISTTGTKTFTFTVPNDFSYLRFYHNGTSRNIEIFSSIANLEKGETYTFSFDLTSVNVTAVGSMVISNAQLELGTTPTPYVPYGYIGLDVYNAQGAHVSTTPIPLPSKGWAGGLPDGAADALSVDSAGRWEWGNCVDEITINGGSGENWSREGTAYRYYMELAAMAGGSDYRQIMISSALPVNQSYVTESIGVCGYGTGGGWLYSYNNTVSTASDFKTWLATHPSDIYYKLKTPTTESGYIDLPDLPEGATVSCLELERAGISVSWFIAGVDELAKHAANWGKRALESESRIAALEAAVAELATA